MHREKHWVKTQIPSARSILQTACCFTDMSSELLLEIDFFFLVVLMNASADNCGSYGCECKLVQILFSCPC